MPGHTPRVSVLLPVYNAEAYLGEAIASILDQSFRDFELLILDDGSRDASPSIAAGYVERDDRVRLSVRENRGLTHTLNELIANARGEYVARMDADDASLPERFAMQVARLDEEPDIVVLGGHAIYMDEAGRPIFSPELPLGHHEIDRLNLGGRTALVHPSVMMRKVAVQEIGGYAPRFNGAEDLDLWLRLAEHGRLANLREIVLRYRLVGSSVSGQRRAEQAAMTRAACEAAWARRDLPARSVSDGDWRPGPDRASRRDFALKWAWQAWRAGNRGTARRFFLKAIQVDPLSAEAWKGMVFGSFRRPRAGEQGASRR